MVLDFCHRPTQVDPILEKIEKLGTQLAARGAHIFSTRSALLDTESALCTFHLRAWHLLSNSTPCQLLAGRRACTTRSREGHARDALAPARHHTAFTFRCGGQVLACDARRRHAVHLWAASSRCREQSCDWQGSEMHIESIVVVLKTAKTCHKSLMTPLLPSLPAILLHRDEKE